MYQIASANRYQILRQRDRETERQSDRETERQRESSLGQRETGPVDFYLSCHTAILIDVIDSCRYIITRQRQRQRDKEIFYRYMMVASLN